MKEVFTTPMTFNAEQLANRKEKAKANYLEGSFCKLSRDFKYPATELHSFNSLEALCDFVADKTLNGQARFPGYLMRQGIAYYDIRIMKPQDEIEADLQSLFSEVEQEYQQELQADYEAKRQLLISQLVAAEKAKEEKKEKEKEQKLLTQAVANADEYLTTLMNQQ